MLVCTRATACRPDPIEAGVAAMRELGEEHGFADEVGEDPSVFTAAPMIGLSAVVFLSTSGEVLTTAGRGALRYWADAGGGVTGARSTARTEHAWPYCGESLGARFAGHRPGRAGVVVVAGTAHPSTAHLGDRGARPCRLHGAGPPRLLLRRSRSPHAPVGRLVLGPGRAPTASGRNGRFQPGHRPGRGWAASAGGGTGGALRRSGGMPAVATRSPESLVGCPSPAAGPGARTTGAGAVAAGRVQCAVQVGVGAVLGPPRVPWKPKDVLPPAARAPL
ncbi:ThuA domain-containing protein [Kitasatospora phosalacinea]|uniref:ThuA domain-containing protein n=1 Tax=Kitasatospora phosalacinea TaxID=2065 RepID=UPI003158208F